MTRAEAGGIPVLQPASARDADFQKAFAAWRPNLGVVVSYGQILDQAMLAIPTQGCVNIHGSLLPRWRGASPVQAALRAGDAVTGVSLQKVVRELDAGAVLAERSVELGLDDDAPTLTGRLAELGAELVVDYLRELGDGRLPEGEAQDPTRVTHCRKIRKEDGMLDWGCSADEVERFVRAMAGWPCAQTSLPDGTGLRIHRGRRGAGASGPIGSIASLDGEIGVICGDGTVYIIEELQRQGRARMAAGEFLRGAELCVGEQLEVN